MLREFREFVVRANVLDLAVALIIGAETRSSLTLCLRAS